MIVSHKYSENFVDHRSIEVMSRHKFGDKVVIHKDNKVDVHRIVEKALVELLSQCSHRIQVLQLLLDHKQYP